MPIPFRQALKRIYRRIPTRGQRAFRRTRDLVTGQQSAATRPGLPEHPSVAELLNITPELLGSTYQPEEVLPMLALENVVLRDRLFTSMNEAEQLGDELAELKTAHNLNASGTEPEEEPELFVDEFLSGSPEPGGASHLVLVNDYVAPGREYSNAFVHRRVKAYQAAGVHVDVVAAGTSAGAGVYEVDGVRVMSGSSADITELLRRRSYTSVSVHFMNPDIWAGIEPRLAELDLHVFFHGYEARRWIRHAGNYPTGNHLERGINRTIDVQRFWRKVINHPHAPASYIFVSDWWKAAAADDLALVFPPRRTHVIHNVIDSDLFRYVPKGPEQRFHLLWVRSASARNYAHDLAIKTLEKLSRSRYWAKARVTIVGDGQHFHEFQQQLGHFPNVTIDQRFVTQQEIARLHRSHGIFLVPSRLDTQGVSRDEAMASGMVPATNLVMAIPEFVDAECAIVADAEDADALAAGIEDLWRHPAKFQRLSRAAAERARRQSGEGNTVARELELFGLASPGRAH